MLYLSITFRMIAPSSHLFYLRSPLFPCITFLFVCNQWARSPILMPIYDQATFPPTRTSPKSAGSGSHCHISIVRICISCLQMLSDIERFTGTVMHTQVYREHQSTSRFENSRVVVVGFGNSGLDLAVELSRVSKKVAQRPQFIRRQSFKP